MTDHPAKREVSVTLATRSIARSAAFYAQLTGREIPVRSGTAEIAPGLLLHQFAVDTLIDDSSVHIIVKDLRATIRRLRLSVTTTEGVPAPIEVRDPDGRVVHVSEDLTRLRPNR
jgi:catechol 2,3-dioxygenase-like lactoylglutathione lyase family enzyme